MLINRGLSPIVTFIVLLLTGCAEPWLNPSHSPVKELGNGEYVYDFKYTEDCLYGDYVKACAKEKLQSLNLVPVQCVNGVKILNKGGPSNGWVWAKFSCN